MSEEAAARRLAICGPNSIGKRQRAVRLRILARQFKSPLIVILFLSGLTTAALGEWMETVVILAALAVNAGMGFWQEDKAETVVQNLKSYILTRAVVRRGGREREISAEELVPGDIIKLAQGARVPADCRVIYANNLEADEAVLTGESLPVAKTIDPVAAGTTVAERHSMLYCGTVVVQGFAEAIITSTGLQSEFGRLAKLAAVHSEDTPLQKAVSYFTVRSSLALGALTLILFFGGLASGHGLLEMFLIAVAVGISAVPESLPVALTVILAVGVERLAKRHGVVKRLLAAETLGSVTLVLTDKTGTLTRAETSLTAVVPYGSGAEAETRLLSLAVLAAEATIENPEDPPGDWRILGRQIEACILRAAAARNVTLLELNKKYTPQDRLPFGSIHRFSAVLARHGGGWSVVLMGAPEALLEFSNLSATEIRTVSGIINERAATGEKILGLASREFTEKPDLKKLVRGGFAFNGILSFRDPLRQDAKESIASLREAGVKTIIVTGDHAGTAEFIARELGIWEDGCLLTGQELAALEAQDLPAVLRSTRVFARVSPEQKLILAKAYRDLGEVVAVSGDGVNDVPALKTADIGIALGSGTEAARSAADLILLRDDFSTLAAAVHEGRKILNNIRKIIVYLLSHSFDELTLIGCSFILGLPLPLNALQILYVNLFSDSFPAVAFAFEDHDQPRRRPSLLRRSILDPEMRWLILSSGVVTSLMLLVIYMTLDGLHYPQQVVRTFIFATFGTYTLVSAFSLRSLRRSILTYNPLGNIKLTVGVLIGLFLTFSSIYFPPLAKILELTPLSLGWVIAVLVVCAANVLIFELSKWVLRFSKEKP